MTLIYTTSVGSSCVDPLSVCRRYTGPEVKVFTIQIYTQQTQRLTRPFFLFFTNSWNDLQCTRSSKVPYFFILSTFSTPVAFLRPFFGARSGPQRSTVSMRCVCSRSAEQDSLRLVSWLSFFTLINLKQKGSTTMNLQWGNWRCTATTALSIWMPTWLSDMHHRARWVACDWDQNIHAYLICI